MTISVSSLVPRGFQWWAIFTIGGHVVGATLVAGRTRAQALATARAIAAELSPLAS